MRYVKRGEFYEGDEPVQDVVAAFEAGEKFTTDGAAEPDRSWTVSVPSPGRYDQGDSYGVLATQTRVRSY